MVLIDVIVVDVVEFIVILILCCCYSYSLSLIFPLQLLF